MTDLQQHPTTSSGWKGNRSRYRLDSPPPAAHISFKPEMVDRQYGWVTIISPEKRWNNAMNHCYVLTRCTGCNAVQWQDLSSLTSGKSKGCQACSQPRQIPKWLDRRLTAAKQRCENPTDPEYRNYGGRGIQFKFPSVLEAGLYLTREFGLPDRSTEMDRIDTNGHYEPGNLRFVSRSENQANRRNTVLSEFNQKYWPYARSVVIQKLSEGMTRDAILLDAENAVLQKRKNWRIISARLDFMIYEMPGHITVLPYRDVSFTTVVTAAV